MGKKEYEFVPPNEQRLCRYLMFSVTANGIGENKWWDIKFPKLIQFGIHLHGYTTHVFGPICLVSMAIYTTINWSQLTFATLGIMFATFPVGIIANIKLVSARFPSYKKLMNEFVGKIHLYSYYVNHKDDEFVKAKIIQVENYARLTSIYITFLLGIDWLLWAIVPIINNYLRMEGVLNGTIRLQTCIYFYTPFDYAYDFEKWAYMHFISSYVSACACGVVATFDAVMFLLVFHLIGHIEVFKNVIKKSFLDEDIDDEIAKAKLIEILKYHSFLVETFDNMQSAYGINVAANYLQNLVEDSLLLYELMFGEKGDKILYGLMVLVYVGELVFMSFVLEEVRRQSYDLPELLYCVPWEDMSLSNRKTFKLMLLKIQPTLSFKAAGGLEAGVNPMVSILKSTFSYYVMLQSKIYKD